MSDEAIYIIDNIFAVFYTSNEEIVVSFTIGQCLIVFESRRLLNLDTLTITYIMICKLIHK